jgi:SAM-dependent methyltransferase
MEKIVTLEQTASDVFYRHSGFCPICEGAREFTSKNQGYRESLHCSGCGSVPRERALALVLTRQFPQWRTRAIHESSPANRGISPKMKRECVNYVASQYFPGKPLGETFGGFRNENLEMLTFGDETFDLVVTLDVMEHVNKPDAVFREISRTLKPGGAYLFTVPTYKGRIVSERRALYKSDGSVEHMAEPEYHGNPVSDAGSLVTFHYGHDLAALIHQWSGMSTEVSRFHDHRHGIIGEFTEVYTSWKPA